MSYRWPSVKVKMLHHLFEIRPLPALNARPIAGRHPDGTTDVEISAFDIWGEDRCRAPTASSRQCLGNLPPRDGSSGEGSRAMKELREQ